MWSCLSRREVKWNVLESEKVLRQMINFLFWLSSFLSQNIVAQNLRILSDDIGQICTVQLVPPDNPYYLVIGSYIICNITVWDSKLSGIRAWISKPLFTSIREQWFGDPNPNVGQFGDPNSNINYYVRPYH